MTDELRRNFLGFVLLLAGVGMILLGTRTQITKLADAGFSFLYMAGLALQVKLQGPKDQPKAEPAP